MFGIVAPPANVLSPADVERYRFVYCGVCHCLKHDTGQLSRLSLSYDCVFLALVHLSLYEDEEHSVNGSCVFHPIANRPALSARTLHYAASMNVLFAYFKLLDDWVDNASRTARIASLLAQHSYRTASEQFPRQAHIIEQGVAALADIEQTALRLHASSAQSQALLQAGDKAAATFGAVLGEIFAPYPDRWQDLLREFGFWLGKFIYLMDAALDVEQDCANATFNVFRDTSLTSVEMRSILATCMRYACEAFEKLPLVQDCTLMRSILYEGVWAQFNAKYEASQQQTLGEHSE